MCPLDPGFGAGFKGLHFKGLQVLLMRAVSQVLLLGLDLVRNRTGPGPERTISSLTPSPPPTIGGGVF